MATPTLEGLDPKSTALVLIDFQRGVIDGLLPGMTFAPHPAAQAVSNGRRVAQALRERGGLVILVRGAMGRPGWPPAPAPQADIVFPDRPAAPTTVDIVPELAEFTQHVVTRNQWGSFYGTDLEPHLRRRGIGTLLVGGVSTNLGVESAARSAHDRGFDQVFIEDAMTAFDGQAHHDTVQRIFPLIGRVRSADEVIEALGR